VRALIVRGHFECASRTRGGLFEDERDVLALEMLPLVTAVLRRLELAGKIQEEADLGGLKSSSLRKWRLRRLIGMLDSSSSVECRSAFARAGKSPEHARAPARVRQYSQKSVGVSSDPRGYRHC